MLDKFLEVAYTRTKEAEDKTRLVESMRKLPNELLMKIASGEEKLAFMGHGGESWLDKFKGSPLFGQAIQLEEQQLQLDMSNKQQWAAESAKRTQDDAVRDELCVKKKMLGLELAKQQEAQLQHEMTETPEDEAMESPQQQAMEQAQGMEMHPAPAAAAKMAEYLGKRASASAVRADVRNIVHNYDLDPREVKSSLSMIKKLIAAEASTHQENADWAAKHPVLNRAPGAIGGALMGAGTGLALSGGGRRGSGAAAAAGAVLGGLLGAALATSPEEKDRNAKAYAAAAKGMDYGLQASIAAKNRLEHISHAREMSVAEAGATKIHNSQHVNVERGKYSHVALASDNMQMTFEQMRKEAIGLAEMGGVIKNVGSQIGKAFTGGTAAAEKAGLGHLSRVGEGVSRAGKEAWKNKGAVGEAVGGYVKANPGQAAALGAGTLAAGYGVKSLFSRPQQPTYQNVNYS